GLVVARVSERGCGNDELKESYDANARFPMECAAPALGRGECLIRHVKAFAQEVFEWRETRSPATRLGLFQAAVGVERRVRIGRDESQPRVAARREEQLGVDPLI